MSLPKGKPQHYFLVAANIIFREPGDDETPMVANVNVVSFTRDGKIPLQAIGRLQQQAQMQFFQETGNPNLIVGKVTILSIMPLGLFTAEEFNAPPPGMKLDEMTAEAVLDRVKAGNA